MIDGDMNTNHNNNNNNGVRSTNGEPASSASSVSIKPAEFCEATASGWFCIIEAQFELAKISVPSTKFYTALAALPANMVQRLHPEIMAEKSYQKLKDNILNLVEKSKPELFESLLSSQVLTGRPSTCLSKLLSTAQKVGVGDDFVRHKFLQSLPPAISPVLAAQSTLSLSQLGTLADELLTLTGNSQSRETFGAISQVSHQPRKQSENNNYADNYFHPSVRPFYSNQKARICRAHIYYGDQAPTCRQYCSWPSKQTCKIEANSRPSSPAPQPRFQRKDLNFHDTQ